VAKKEEERIAKQRLAAKAQRHEEKVKACKPYHFVPSCLSGKKEIQIKNGN
jgi:hypothetical protein